MPALEFTVPPADLTRLLRHPALSPRSRPQAASIVWHDTAAGELAAKGTSLANARGRWRLERAAPSPGVLFPPGTPSPLLTEAATPEELGPLPGPLMPIAGFRGTRRTADAAPGRPVAATVLEGALRGLTEEKPCCRLVLDGDGAALAALSRELSELVRLEIPRWSLATEAASFARGWPPPDRQTGAPEVLPGTSVGDALVLVVGHLTDVILAGVQHAASGETAEPVHAMRVAARRLRSALSVFRKVADGPSLQALKPQITELASVLGQARDWDVFLAGTGQEVAQALDGDKRIAAMLTAASHKRDAAYAALRRYFASPAFRRLTLGLVTFAALRPFTAEGDEDRADALAGDVEDYASALLAKRHDHMLAPGADISGLPVPELHELRKQGKRFRYTAEFFAPFYGRRSTRRFVREVSRLQDALGQLNDGGAAAALMGALRGGPDMVFADGAVQGYAAARSVEARCRIAKRWTKFRRAQPFWA